MKRNFKKYKLYLFCSLYVMSFSLQLEQNICTGIDLYVCVCVEIDVPRGNSAIHSGEHMVG